MVIDTSALVSILLGEPEAEAFARAMAGAAGLYISAPTWMEASMVITALLGAEGQALSTELLTRSRVEIVACDAALAQTAYEAWLTYGRGRHPAGLNYGDCFSYALAKRRSDVLLYKGEDFVRTDINGAV